MIAAKHVPVLTKLGIAHTIKPSDSDGNCFYTAVAQGLGFHRNPVMHLGVAELRRLTASAMTDNDLGLHNSVAPVHETFDTLPALQAGIRRTQNGVWADDIHITALRCQLSDIGFVIFTTGGIVCNSTLHDAHSVILLWYDNRHYELIMLRIRDEFTGLARVTRLPPSLALEVQRRCNRSNYSHPHGLSVATAVNGGGGYGNDRRRRMSHHRPTPYGATGTTDSRCRR
jgi:hypothetical protein